MVSYEAAPGTKEAFGLVERMRSNLRQVGRDDYSDVLLPVGCCRDPAAGDLRARGGLSVRIQNT